MGVSRQGLRAFSGTTESMNIIDRFSNLPEEVAHHILSFLPITDLTRFGCVSKNCRELYLSTPSLNFHEFPKLSRSSGSRRLRLMSYLERFLLVHRRVNKIQRFHIDWVNACWKQTNFYEDEKFRMITWIHNATRCNVEVLHLEINMFLEKLPIPSFIFLCGSLRSLFIGGCCSIPKAPSLASFSNLEYLRLNCVDISDEGFFKWISCCCKCIKELHLEQIRGVQNVTIESSSLKSFSFRHYCNTCHLNISGEKLEDIHMHWGLSCSGSNKSCNIVAPNLKYLKWSGRFLIHQNLGKLECVEKAELLLVPKADEFNILFEFLCSIRRVEALILNKETTMALFNGGSMPASFKNVCYLSLHVGNLLDSPLVPAMVSLFGGMPNLSTLDIKSYPHSKFDDSDTAFNMGYWKLQNLAFIDQLKEVTIELSGGSNGIEFARYILEDAQNLKKMVIVDSPAQSNAIRTLNKSKITSNATVVFHKR